MKHPHLNRHEPTQRLSLLTWTVIHWSSLNTWCTNKVPAQRYQEDMICVYTYILCIHNYVHSYRTYHDKYTQGIKTVCNIIPNNDRYSTRLTTSTGPLTWPTPIPTKGHLPCPCPARAPPFETALRMASSRKNPLMYHPPENERKSPKKGPF